MCSVLVRPAPHTNNAVHAPNHAIDAVNGLDEHGKETIEGFVQNLYNRLKKSVC